MERPTTAAAGSRKCCTASSNHEEAPSGGRCFSPESSGAHHGSSPVRNAEGSSSGPSSSSTSNTTSSGTASSVYHTSHCGHGCMSTSPSSRASATTDSSTSNAEGPPAAGSGAHRCSNFRSSCSCSCTNTALFEGSVRYVPRGSRTGVSEEICSTSCALCSNQPPALARSGCNGEECVSAWTPEGEGDPRERHRASRTRLPCKEGSDDAKTQSPVCKGVLFSSALLLWLLAPFLYLNELTKLRLLSKSLNSRWLTLHRLRRMMCNSIALVFPAQWELPSHQCRHQHHQRGGCCSPRLLLPQPSSGEELREHQQPQRRKQQDEEQHESNKKRQKQQYREARGEQDKQQQTAEVENRDLQGTPAEQVKTETPEAQQQQQKQRWQQQEGGGRTQQFRLRLEIRQQELQAEQSLRQCEAGHQQRPLTPTVFERPTPAAHTCVINLLHSPAAPCSSSPVDATAAAGSEAAGESAVTAILHGGSLSSRQRAPLLACDGNGARLTAASASSSASAPGNTEAENEEEVAAAGAYRTGRRQGERQAEAHALGGAPAQAEDSEKDSGGVAVGCTPRAAFPCNFLQAMLLQPPSYGCAALQLRQLTLHMPESPEAVLSLQQFKTYKDILELCSPTLEELCLIDFSSFYIVADVPPALQDVLQRRESTGGAAAAEGAAVAYGLSSAAGKKLTRAISVVNSAFEPLPDPTTTDDAGVTTAGEAAASTAAVTAAAQSPPDLSASDALGNSAPGAASSGNQELEPVLPGSPPWQLTLSFKIWNCCRGTLEEDATEDDEIQAIENAEDDSSDVDTVSPPREGESAGACSFWSANSFGDPAATLALSSCPSCAVEDGSQGPTPSGGVVRIDPAGPPIAEGMCMSLRLREPQEAARQSGAAVITATRAAEAERLPSSPAATPPTADAAREERAVDCMRSEAAAGVPSFLAQRESTSAGGLRRSAGFSKEPHALSREEDDEHCGYSAAASVSSVAVPVATAAASAAAVGRANAFFRGAEGLPCAAAMQPDVYRIPAATEVYQLVHNTVRRLKLNCCFPQLKRLHVYGYSDWKSARPYFSCLACLFLPRGSESHGHSAENSAYTDKRSDADTQGRRASSRSTQRNHSSDGSSDESHGSGIEEIRSSSSQQTRSRTGCGLASRRRTSSSGSLRQSRSRSRSSRICRASPRSRNQRSTRASNTPERGCREPSSSGGCSLDSQRRRGGSRTLRGEDYGVISKGKNDDVGDAAAGNDATSSVIDCSSARIAVVAGDGGGNRGEKAKGTVPESALAFPNLEELSWLDASCVVEDMCDFILASQTERLQKLSFSTYCPSAISLLLEKCVSHPRVFRHLRELDIDGLNFIWTEDEWWWFAGNSWTRFVEIWRLHAINRYHLAPTYPVPRTLQQLEVLRRQQQQQRCRQQRADAGTAGGVQPHPTKQRQPSHQGRGHRHGCAGRGAGPIRSKEIILDNSTQKRWTQFQDPKEHVQEREVLCSGGSGAVERKHQASEDTGEREGYTAEREECAEQVCEGAWLEGMTEVDDEARRLSETRRWDGGRERSSRSRRSEGRHELEAKGASCRRWRCTDDCRRTDEEKKHEERKRQQSEELPLGFVGMAADVDYKGIKRALDRLPRVRKLRLLSFTGDILGGPDDSTHTLGSFFPEADLEIQGSVLIPRRLLQKFLMKIIRKAHAAEKRDRQQSTRRSADKNVLKWGRALRAPGVACSGSVGGVKQQHKERQSRLLLHSAFSSDAEGGKDSSDDSLANTSLEFPTASAVLSHSTVQSAVGSVTNRLLSEEPVTSRTDVLLEWRRLISEEVRLNPDPVGQEYVIRWLRDGLVYKVRMTLAIRLAEQAELRVDPFHQECVSVYIGDVLAGLPYWKRKKSVRATHANSLRILELTDCIHETNTPLEGYKDARGYFIPFGRVKDVLAYFTPFLLGLDCFSPYIPLQCGEADEEDSTCWPAQDTFREGGTDSSENDAAREEPGDEDEDVENAEEAHRMGERVHRSSGRGSWKAEDERLKIEQRRRTVHVDCDLARDVYAGGIQHKETNKVLQRRTLSAEENYGRAWAFRETCRGRPPSATVVGFPARNLEDAAPLVGVDTDERGAAGERLLSPGRACTAGQRGTETESWPVSAASGGARDTLWQTVASDDVPSPDGNLPETSLRILRLKGVVGLALPLYTRFVDYRRLGDVVRRVAQAYRAQTRVLLVTNGTLLFYKRNKTHHDVALAALARDFQAVTKECMEALQVIDYRVYRPVTWRCELGENQEHRYMPAFLRAFFRHNPEFRLARRLDCIRPVDNELESDLQRVKSTLTAYIWIRRR